MKDLEKQALEYHAKLPAGKLAIALTKPVENQSDLSLAYSPGVAAPCKCIAKNPEKVYDYTAKGNLVAVISNGTSVLGLGNIGPYASKPVMEGKALLLKKFAGVDAFDLELDEQDPQKLIEIITALAPTFGAINLEDIKAPECFVIEKALQDRLNIPVFHDDQHGTAIVSGAALLNALEITGKRIEDIQVVINGAGAAGIACAHFYVLLGIQKKNIVMCDSKGAMHSGRFDLNPYKAEFITDRSVSTLSEAIRGADMFLGVSIAGALHPNDLKQMASNPIVFALANPDPEIDYETAMAVREDIIMATGRSDYPNQVNNVLGFPYIFRGALDARAASINESMKLAAVHAITELAKEPVPSEVIAAYGNTSLCFGRKYLLPKPMDPRLRVNVSTAVLKAAQKSGVARI